MMWSVKLMTMSHSCGALLMFTIGTRAAMSLQANDKVHEKDKVQVNDKVQENNARRGIHTSLAAAGLKRNAVVGDH
jgi:hypothetical protein